MTLFLKNITKANINTAAQNGVVMHISFPALSDGTIDGIVCSFKYTSDTADDIFTCFDSSQTSNTATPTQDAI